MFYFWIRANYEIFAQDWECLLTCDTKMSPPTDLIRRMDYLRQKFAPFFPKKYKKSVNYLTFSRIRN